MYPQALAIVVGLPFVEGFDALGLGGAGFFSLRGSLVPLRWPLAIFSSFLGCAAYRDDHVMVDAPLGHSRKVPR